MTTSVVIVNRVERLTSSLGGKVFFASPEIISRKKLEYPIKKHPE